MVAWTEFRGSVMQFAEKRVAQFQDAASQALLDADLTEWWDG